MSRAVLGLELPEWMRESIDAQVCDGKWAAAQVRSLIAERLRSWDGRPHTADVSAQLRERALGDDLA